MVDGVIGTVTDNQESNMPTYTSNVPLATQQINQTQAPIQTNFQSLQQLIDINHVDFSDPVNFGKHNVSDYVAQVNTPLGSVPAFITGLPANEFNIYNTVPNGTTVLTPIGYPVTLATNELIIQRATSPNSFIPITATTNGNDGASGTYGWSYLPSGILHKWGNVVNTTGRARDTAWTYTLPTAMTIPVLKTVQTVLITSTDKINNAVTPGLNITVFQSATTTTITVYPLGTFGSGTNANDWSYLIIGT